VEGCGLSDDGQALLPHELNLFLIELIRVSSCDKGLSDRLHLLIDMMSIEFQGCGLQENCEKVGYFESHVGEEVRNLYQQKQSDYDYMHPREMSRQRILDAYLLNRCLRQQFTHALTYVCEPRRELLVIDYFHCSRP
jgi:hypothetical protein